MEMPKSCYDCKFLSGTYGERFYCMLNEEIKLEIQERIYQYSNKRHQYCPLQEMKNESMKKESMENNKNCANCIYYEVDEINTVDKSNPRGVCHALPSLTIIRHREIPCIYYKEKDN